MNKGFHFLDCNDQSKVTKSIKKDLTFKNKINTSLSFDLVYLNINYLLYKTAESDIEIQFSDNVTSKKIENIQRHTITLIQ